MFKLGLEKAEESEIKLPTSVQSSKKQEFQKNIYFCFIDYAKAFDCVDYNKLENSERDGNTRPPDLPPEKSVCSGSEGKASACNMGDMGSIPGLGRSPGEGNSYPLQCSGLENPMNCIVHGVTECQT